MAAMSCYAGTWYIHLYTHNYFCHLFQQLVHTNPIRCCFLERVKAGESLLDSSDLKLA